MEDCSTDERLQQETHEYVERLEAERSRRLDSVSAVRRRLYITITVAFVSKCKRQNTIYRIS